MFLIKFEKLVLNVSGEGYPSEGQFTLRLRLHPKFYFRDFPRPENLDQLLSPQLHTRYLHSQLSHSTNQLFKTLKIYYKPCRRVLQLRGPAHTSSMGGVGGDIVPYIINSLEDLLVKFRCHFLRLLLVLSKSEGKF